MKDEDTIVWSHAEPEEENELRMNIDFERVMRNRH